MASAQLPLTALPAWEALNNVRVRGDVRVADVPGKGFGLVAGPDPPSAAPASSGSPLMTVPRGLVLHAEAVEDYAKQDRHFRQLLDAVGAGAGGGGGRRSPRGDVVLFLVVQLVLARGRATGKTTAALSTPWTEYVRFLLAASAPLPTLWTDAERALLRGTSLEAALEAKRWALEHEFDTLHTQSSELPVWQAALWADGREDEDDDDNDDDFAGGEDRLRLRDWVLADAWYRSRCLELPRAGPAMVPCVDMANHSAMPSAFFEEVAAADDDAAAGDVLLLPWPQQRPSSSSSSSSLQHEITIDYAGGVRTKPAAEFLFSYGFLDPEATSPRLVLPFEALPDDPLAQAKLHVFGSAPRLHIALRGPNNTTKDDDDDDDDDDGNDTTTVHWRCPFALLACVNEEDGLDFRLRQETDGATQLRVFWQDEDVTERMHVEDKAGGDAENDSGDNDDNSGFEALTRSHVLAPVLRLRVVTVVQQVVEEHLDRMQQAAASAAADKPQEDVNMDGDHRATAAVRSDVARQAGLLRDLESRILSRALEELETERADLLSNPTVVQYLESMATTASDHSENENDDENDDENDNDNNNDDNAQDDFS